MSRTCCQKTNVCLLLTEDFLRGVCATCTPLLAGADSGHCLRVSEDFLGFEVGVYDGEWDGALLNDLDEEHVDDASGAGAEIFEDDVHLAGACGGDTESDFFDGCSVLASGFVCVFHVGNKWTNGRSIGYEATS